MALSLWQLVTVGISHNTSKVEEREPLQIGREDIAKAHATLSDMLETMECTIVSTCNRVEFYIVAKREYDPFEVVNKFYKDFRNLDLSNLEDKFYVKKNKHAAYHLFKVGAGLDSMVLGENQILAQIKEAYSSSCAVKAAGKVIHRLFHQAFRVAKQIRTDTEMGKGACSVSSAALELLQTKTKGLKNPSVLFIGINQMINLAARGLAKRDYRQFAFANRTGEKAEAVAQTYGAKGYPLSELPALLNEADIVITSTGSTAPIINKEIIDTVTENNPGKRLFIVDMAIPRDTGFDSSYKENIEVLDLESIKEFVQTQQAKREEAIPQAESIIERKLNEFMYWYDHVRHEPIYNGLGDTFEVIRQKELASVLGDLSPEQQEIVNRATKSLTDRLLQLKVRTGTKAKESE